MHEKFFFIEYDYTDFISSADRDVRAIEAHVDSIEIKKI